MKLTIEISQNLTIILMILGIFLLTICMSNLYLLFLLFLPITFCINGNIKNEINN